MKYTSTRNKNILYTLSDAMRLGLAPDGGLFIPTEFPIINLHSFNSKISYVDFSVELLNYYFKEDLLHPHLDSIIKKALNFPTPLTEINHNTYLLELFHGPTASFKDIGTQFLAESFSYLNPVGETCIMVATSGDTGAAVANAFYDKPSFKVIILYPKNLISSIQEKHLTAFNKNICALAVSQSFDHCQNLVKSAFADAWWQKNLNLNSANSINIGRLIPQMTYYAYISLKFFQSSHEPASFIVPTGNLGNALAAFWAKKMGFPIKHIVMAINSNTTLKDYLESGTFQPKKTIATIANAMDVGNPSNFERLQDLFPKFDNFKDEVQVISVNDDDIRKTIKACYLRYKKIICPHTATAFYARHQLCSNPWIVVATAEPGKFNNIIEPIIGVPVPISPQLKQALNSRRQPETIVNSLDDIKRVITNLNWINKNVSP